MPRFLAIPVLAALVLAAGSAQAASLHAPADNTGRGVHSHVVLESLSLSGNAQRATLTLQLSQPVHERWLSLSSPERLVIDLPGTRRHAPLPQIPADSPLQSLRSGMHDEHTLRLVLGLRSSVAHRIRWHVEAEGTQLRIELAGITIRAAHDARNLRDLQVAPVAGVAAATVPAPAPAIVSAVQTSPAVFSPLRVIAPAHAPQSARDVIIAVDAGHGGVDPGATGPDGVHEKNVTLAIARALAARIDAQSGMHAVLTRDGDYFVPLRDRMERARAAHADLFVSIHADSVRDRGISGCSVYILSERGASSEAARRLADQENAADLKGGISLSAQAPALRSILMDLSQNESMGQSGEAAQDVLGALDRVGAVRKREVQQAAFVVLKSPDVPSMLVETAYISNPGDEQRLRDPVQQQRLAGAIFSGIAAYFRHYPPQGSLFARTHGDRTGGDAKGAS